MNRYKAKNGDYWNNAAVIAASSRTDTKQNCMIAPSSGWDGITLTWGTYCPPKKTSTIADNGTTLNWGGSGTSGDPYLIPTSSTIKVSASCTDHVNDANMTTKYNFQVRNSTPSEITHSDGTATTWDYAVPATNNRVYRMRVNSYNYYNSTSSTEKWSSEIYYKAYTPYTISYNAGTGGSGSHASETKLYNVSFTLPNSIVFTRTGYTQTGWTTSDLGTQTHALGGSYTTNAAQAFYPVWTAKTTTTTLNANTDNHGSGSNGSATATYDNGTLTSITHTNPAAGYYLEGYYTDATNGTMIITAEGTLVRNTAYTTDEDTPLWKNDAETLTVYAHYAPIWRIVGGDTGEDDGDDEMGDWDADANPITHITESAGVMTEGYVDITLSANKDYQFKVFQTGNATPYWGKTGAVIQITYANKATAVTLTNNDGSNQTIRTATAGTYRFTWNVTNRQISISYPHTACKILISHGWEPTTGNYSATSNTASAKGGTITSAVASVTGALQVDGNHGTQYIQSGETVVFTHSAAASGYTWDKWGSGFVAADRTITAYTAGANVAINDAAGTLTLSNITGTEKHVYALFKENATTVTVNAKAGQSGYGQLKFGSTDKSWGSTASVGVTTGQSMTADGSNYGYKLKSWTLSGDATLASGALTDKTITVKGNGTDGSTGTATAEFEYGYVLRGSLNDDSGTGGLPGWSSTTSYIVPTGEGTTGIYTATRNRGTKYKLKVIRLYDNYFYGSQQNTDWVDGETRTLGGGGYDVVFTAGANGTYTFTFDFTSKALTITYPNQFLQGIRV